MKIHTWKRFVDDIFIIWTGTTNEYMQCINQIHPTIKFTHEISEQKLTFLDVMLYKGDRFKKSGDLKTHIKDTNKQSYVHSTSYHPPTTKRAISKGETKRYLCTNSNEGNFKRMTLKLIHKLKQRGYKQEEILKQIQDIKFTDRQEALKRKTKATGNHRLTFITMFSDDIHRFKTVFKKHWSLIK